MKNEFLMVKLNDLYNDDKNYKTLIDSMKNKIAKTLFKNKCFHMWCVAMIPSGFLALLAGWFVTEVGRQPYTVYGVMKTANSISPVIAEQVMMTLIGFIVVYVFIFGAGIHYVVKLVRKGPDSLKEKEKFYDHGLESSMVKAVTEGESK